MAKSIFKEMGGTYEMQGDYLIFRLALPAEEKRNLSAHGDSDMQGI